MKKVIGVVLACIALSPFSAYAMSSTNFQVLWDSMNIGGLDNSTSANYGLRDTIGEMATGLSSSTNFQISAGYRVGDTEQSFLSFSLGTQENGTQTAWTAFSDAGKTVDVASAAGYAIGDYIGVIEDVGTSQLVAVGYVIGISGNTITVNSWGGQPASLSAVPSGSNDYVFRLNGTAAALGNQTVSGVKTSITRTNITTNAPNGYSVRVISDGDLTSGANTMTPVADGAVTASFEEYGGEVVGTPSVGSGGDFAFSSTSTRIIQSGAGVATDERVAILYKLAISAASEVGDYTQHLFYTATASY